MFNYEEKYMQNIDPLIVRKLRIYLANNEVIDSIMLDHLAGNNLVNYMVTQLGFPEQDLTEEDGLHWKCRDLATWMRQHPKLVKLYEDGKRQCNPSGRTAEDNERNRLKKLRKVS
jgi:hypothetical protein